jgi:hypothetical protein
MRMPRLKKSGRAGLALGAALSACLLLAVAGCKKSSGLNTNSNIYISNDSGADVRVYLDGTLEATIDSDDNGTISSVTEGDRLFEAKVEDTGVTILTRTLDIEADSTNTVTIYGPSTLRITNNSGEIVHIYDADDEYIGDIGVNISLVLPKITFGSHTFTAIRISDSTQVSTITFEVTDVAEYTWTITP